MQDSISTIASQVIANLQETIANSPTGVSFVSINGYTNAKDEVSNVLINVGRNYGTVKAEDLQYLKKLFVIPEIINSLLMVNRLKAINLGIFKSQNFQYLKKAKNGGVIIPNKEPKKDKAFAVLQNAKEALIASQIAPSKARSEAQTNAYTRLANAPQIKVHNQSGKIFIEGYQVSKKVIVKGTYKAVNSRPLTIAKNAIKKGMKVSKIRQYTLTEINLMRLNKKTLEFNQPTI